MLPPTVTVQAYLSRSNYKNFAEKANIYIYIYISYTSIKIKNGAQHSTYTCLVLLALHYFFFLFFSKRSSPVVPNCIEEARTEMAEKL